MPNQNHTFDWSLIDEFILKMKANETEAKKGCNFENGCADWIIVGVVYFGFLFTLFYKVMVARWL